MVDTINGKNGMSVCDRTIRDYVGKGDTVLATKRDNQKSDLPSNVEFALEAAMHTYTQIECAHRESQPTQ